MWIITAIGCYSLTNHRDQPKNMMVRGRVRSDMERLVPLIPFWALHSDIIETYDSDYKYRIIADREAMGGVFGKLVANMDYIGFKDNVADKQGKTRAQIYYDVWDILHELQEDEVRLMLEERMITK